MADPMRIRATMAGDKVEVRVLMAHEMETGQRKDAKGNKDWGALPDVYLKNLREATRKKREQLKIDEKDKKWLLPLQDELQKAAYEATFGTVDLVALRKAWIKAMASWKR